jgi:hypothetical protein
MSNIELVKSQMDLLKVLANERYRKVIISKADSNLVKAICQGIHNVLKGNISISNYERERLKKFRKVLHKLLKKSTLQSKKKILIQQGGFLQFLIPAVVSGIASIISSAISGHKDSNSE